MCLFFFQSCPTVSHAKWELGVWLTKAPASQHLRLLLPPPDCITWLMLSWLSVVLTAWPPGGSQAKCHVTSGSASPGSGPQSFSHPHPPLTPPPLHSSFTWNYLKKRTICLFLSIYSSLCFCGAPWEDLGAVLSANGNANIKQYSVIISHTASTGLSSMFVIRLETRTSTAANKHSYHTH